MRHNPRLTLIIVWSILIFVIAITIGSYILNFKSADISDKTDSWGQFGDYIGGILNPFLAILNLVVISYISFTLAHLEENRSQATLRELARPLGSIICGDYEDCIEVKLKNCGLGPLIINSISVFKDNIFIGDNLVNQLPSPPIPITWRDFVVSGPDFVVSKECEINLAKVELPDSNVIIEEYKLRLRTALSQLTIEIEYRDMYGQNIGIARRNLGQFARRI